MSQHAAFVRHLAKRRREDPEFNEQCLQVQRAHMKDYKVGSKVHVKLFDGRVLEATVKAIHETVAGRRVSVAAGHMALRLRAEQIVKVLKS